MAKSNVNQRLRARLLLYPKFQLALVAAAASMSVLTAVVCYLTIHNGFEALKQMGEQAQLSAGHPYYDFLRLQSAKIFVALGVGALLSMVMSISFMLLITHKLVGPLHRLRTYLQDIADTGQCSAPLQFRNGDYLADLPEIVNQALSAVQKSKQAKGGRAS